MNAARCLALAALLPSFGALAAPAPAPDLAAQLSALPQLDPTAVLRTESDLRFNSEDPTRIPRTTSDEPFDPFATEQRLMEARMEVNAPPVTTLSLSTLVAKTPLAACSQLCSISLPLEGDIPSNLTQLSCDGGSIVRVREYPDPEHGTAFSLPREKVNLLVNGRPAWLQRINRMDGTAETILAWRGAAQGYSLVFAGVEDVAARHALAYAEAMQ